MQALRQKISLFLFWKDKIRQNLSGAIGRKMFNNYLLSTFKNQKILTSIWLLVIWIALRSLFYTSGDGGARECASTGPCMLWLGSRMIFIFGGKPRAPFSDWAQHKMCTIANTRLNRNFYFDNRHYYGNHHFNIIN